jgi:tetratricopeptide (TPR) repeat protein
MKALLILILGISLSAFGNVAELTRQGDVHDIALRPAKALEFYLPAEKLAPDDVELLVKIARQYSYLMDDATSKPEKIKQGTIALEYSERAVKADSKSSDAHLSVAICLGKLALVQSNKEKIAAAFRIKNSAETAARLNPRSDYAWHILGRWHQALASTGTIAKSIGRFLYGALPEGSNEESVKFFEKAIAANPSRLIHHIELGRTYANMGRVEEAREALNRGLAMPSTEKEDEQTKQRGRDTLRKIS